MKNLFLAILLAVFAFTSCSKDSGGGDPAPLVLTGGTTTTQTVYADQTSGSGSGIKFAASAPWTASVTASKAGGSDLDWLTLNAYSGGAGEQTLTMTLKENTTGADRKAQISIVCGGTTITITVEQKGVTEGGEKPKPKLAQVSKTIYTSNSDAGNGAKPEVTLYTYDNNGRIILMEQQYQIIYEVGIDGKPGKVEDHKMTINVTYEGNNVSYKLSSTEWPETYSGTAKLNAQGYVESATTKDRTYQMSYNADSQIERVKEVNKKGEERINICRWSNGNLTTLVWGTNGEETATYSSYPNDKINLDINWLLLQYLEGFAFLDGSDAENSLYAIQNMFGVRSKNYVSEFWANYTWSGISHSTNGRIFEYEFNAEGLPIKIKEYHGKGSLSGYNGTLAIEYNKL